MLLCPIFSALKMTTTSFSESSGSSDFTVPNGQDDGDVGNHDTISLVDLTNDSAEVNDSALEGDDDDRAMFESIANKSMDDMAKSVANFAKIFNAKKDNEKRLHEQIEELSQMLQFILNTEEESLEESTTQLLKKLSESNYHAKQQLDDSKQQLEKLSKSSDDSKQQLEKLWKSNDDWKQQVEKLSKDNEEQSEKLSKSNDDIKQHLEKLSKSNDDSKQRLEKIHKMLNKGREQLDASEDLLESACSSVKIEDEESDVEPDEVRSSSVKVSDLKFDTKVQMKDGRICKIVQKEKYCKFSVFDPFKNKISKIGLSQIKQIISHDDDDDDNGASTGGGGTLDEGTQGAAVDGAAVVHDVKSLGGAATAGGEAVVQPIDHGGAGGNNTADDEGTHGALVYDVQYPNDAAPTGQGGDRGAAGGGGNAVMPPSP